MTFCSVMVRFSQFVKKCHDYYNKIQTTLSQIQSLYKSCHCQCHQKGRQNYFIINRDIRDGNWLSTVVQRFLFNIRYLDIIVKILGLVLRKTSEIWFSNIVSHYSNICHSRDLNALYESPKVGNPQGNATLSFSTINGAKKAGEKTPFLQLFWTNFIPFSSSTGPKQSCVTCHFFLALLLLDRKAWEVARHIFGYCLDIN